MSTIEKLKTNWTIIIAGFGGGFVAGIVDIITNEEAAFTYKVSNILFKRGVEINAFWPLVIVAAISGFIIWGMETGTRRQAMIQGLSILSVLTVITPYKNEGLQSQKTEPIAFSASISTTPSLLKLAVYPVWQNGIKSNAEILENRWISSTKPEVSPLKSFFNNSIGITKKNHILKKGDRVKIIDCWDTPLRGYRYVQIEYEHNEKIETGWIWSGKSPEYWYAVKPDNSEVCAKK